MFPALSHFYWKTLFQNLHFSKNVHEKTATQSQSQSLVKNADSRYFLNQNFLERRLGICIFNKHPQWSWRALKFKNHTLNPQVWFGTDIAPFLQYLVGQSCHRHSQIQESREMNSPPWWETVKVTLQKSMWGGKQCYSHLWGSLFCMWEGWGSLQGRGKAAVSSPKMALQCITVGQQSPSVLLIHGFSSALLTARGLYLPKVSFLLMSLLSWPAPPTQSSYLTLPGFTDSNSEALSWRSFVTVSPAPPGWLNSFSLVLMETLPLNQSLCQCCNYTSNDITFLTKIIFVSFSI